MAWIIIAGVSITIKAQESVEQQFEEHFQDWKEFCSRPEVMILSLAGPRFTCTEFRAITDLGIPALPYIAAKMEYDTNRDLLWKAIEVIAKVKIRGEYDNSSSRVVFPQFPALKSGEDVYLYWWREGHKSTQARFEEFYSKWKQIKDSNNEVALKSYKDMVNLGLPVIPYMINRIENGDSGLIPAVSQLVDGEIKEDISPKECADWWYSNRDRWTINFQNIEINKSDILKNEFESEYRAWKKAVDEKGFSSAPQYNEHFYEIIDMRAPVLPFIIEKMEKKEYGLDFLLESAFYFITKMRFDKSEWPKGKLGDSHTAAAMYVDWWHNGIKDTEKSFNHYYQQWSKCKAENNTEKADEILRHIDRLGIAAIPFMIEKINNGDKEFIKIISGYSFASMINRIRKSDYKYDFIESIADNKNTKLNENASIDEFTEWWSANKDLYTIIQGK